MTELTVGLAGAGHIAGAHLRAWRRAPGCRVAGIYDLRPEAAAARAHAFGVARVYDDLGALIADCQVVDVCTPPDTHAELARRVLDAGRHLLIEKPIVTRLDDWGPLHQRLAAAPVKAAVIHNLKYARAVQLAKRWLEAGRIGRPLRLTRYFLTSPEGDRMLAAERHWSHGLPGGRWFETLPHALYLIHYLLGPLRLAAVEAQRRGGGATPGAAAEEVLIMFSGDGCFADVHYSARCRLNKRQLVIHGETGVLTVDLLADSVALTRGRDRRWRRATGGRLADSAVQLGQWVPDRIKYLSDRLRGLDPHRRLIDAFARHLHDDGPSPTPLAEIDYVVRNSHRIGTAIERQLAER